MLHVPREKTFSQCPTPATGFSVDTTWRCPDNAIRKKHATRHVWSAAPATQNDDGGLQSDTPATKNATHLLKTLQKYRACHTKRSWTLLQARENVSKCHAATQNGMTTCFETFENDRSCSFSCRHGDGRRKPENRDETCWSFKTSISCETASNFHTS